MTKTIYYMYFDQEDKHYFIQNIQRGIIATSSLMTQVIQWHHQNLDLIWVIPVSLWIRKQLNHSVLSWFTKHQTPLFPLIFTFHEDFTQFNPILYHCLWHVTAATMILTSWTQISADFIVRYLNSVTQYFNDTWILLKKGSRKCIKMCNPLAVSLQMCNKASLS